MIKNDKQHQVTKKRLMEFNAALNEINEQAQIDPLLKQLQVNAIKSQIDDFEKDVAEYENLKSGTVNYIVIDSIENLHEALIKGRLAKGLTQGDLAIKLKLKEQQIQRYEACNYSTASLPRIFQIANELEVRFYPIKARLKDPKFSLPEKYNNELVINAQEKLKERKTLICVK